MLLVALAVGVAAAVAAQASDLCVDYVNGGSFADSSEGSLLQRRHSLLRVKATEFMLRSRAPGRRWAA